VTPCLAKIPGMPSPAFVHLRLHSEYSISDGLVRIDDAIAAALADGQPALALTDLANLFGMVKFYSGARSKGLKPIIGADVWIAPPVSEEGREECSRLLVLCRNRAGYLRLCELMSAAYLSPRRQGRAEITREALASGDNSGLIVLSGAKLGDVGRLLIAGKAEPAAARAREWAALFPGNYYIEVQRPTGRRELADAPEQEHLVADSADLAAQLDLPLVATHPIQFLHADDFKAHEARVCISEGHVLADTRRPRNFHEAQYFKTSAEMVELFADLPEALANAAHIAQRCNLTVELGKSRLPDFPTPDGSPLNDYLASESHRGLEERLLLLYPDPSERDAARPRYVERLDFEIQTIIKMGFPGYFLIVADFIIWGKNNGVPVGPGRGSGAGSLVAYSLKITDLDPLRYDLLFERFLNPERVSMPDFDIDFCQENRGKVIKYVKEKYGHHAVSQIATFGTMAAKAVIRDVGRVSNLGFNFVDQFAKLIPNELGITLKDALEKEPAIRERIDNEEEIAELWALAIKLEGVTRNVGMHAGGVLIAPGKLTDFCPLYAASADPEDVVSQFDKDDVEKAGLVKFDFLGLRTLTIIEEAITLVREVEGVEIDLARVPIDDKATYDGIFKTARTTAVFQFESGGMKDTLTQAKPDCLEDLIALNALYRPGPMDFIPNFVNRKHGREKTIIPHPTLEKVVGNTYGIMVYQEQVMQAAQVVAGYSLGGADLLRRAMGKKKPEEMAQQRQIFVEGAAGNNIDADKANEIFDTMEKFAGYGFNKSHAAAYSLVAYHTGWLKQHHPAAFAAATMSSEMANTDKLQFFFKDATDNGLAFLPPDINESGIRFRPTDARTIRYALGAIKGTGEAALSVILATRRKDGPFTDLFDFCRRIDKRTVNRRVIDALIRAGAFDTLDTHRARLLASVPNAMDAAEQAERNALQSGLFDDAPSHTDETHYVEVKPWTERERLMNEKPAIGFFLSGHPYHEYASEIASFVKRRLGQLEISREPVLLAGLIMAMRTQMTRRGKMAVITLDDATTQLEVTVFNELWDAERHKLKEDELLFVEGKVSLDQFSGGLRVSAEKLMTLAQARSRYARLLRLTITSENSNNNAAQRLQNILAPYREPPSAERNSTGCRIRLRYSNPTATTEFPLPADWSVRLDDALIAALNDWLTPANVHVVYS
jgi:DNA polymerase III subunit alpha